mgnify:CR=1 FL=1
MQRFDQYSMTGRTETDNKKILDYLDREIDLFIDDADRVFNNNQEYIANGVRTEQGNGIGC